MLRDDVSPKAFRQRLIRSIAVSPALVAALAAVFLGQINYLMTAARWVDHADRAIAGANHLLKLLIDGETGVRGYLITGAPEFLEPYKVEEERIEPAFRELSELVSDHPEQAQLLASLKAAHNEWRTFAPRLIALRREGGDYRSVVRTGKGKRRMDAMRRQIAAFIDTEERLRDRRTEEVRWATRTVIGTCLGLSLAIGIGLASFTRRQLNTATASYRQALDHASRLATIVESSEDAIIGVSPGRTITSWNPGAAQLYGYRESEAVGAPVTLLIPPNRADEPSMIFERLDRGERIEPYQTRRVTKGGDLIDVSLSVFPLRDRDGQTVGTAAIARDVTARERSREALERLARRLEALHQIDRAILTAESLERVLSTALVRVVGAVPCERVAVALLDEPAGWATIVAADQDGGPTPMRCVAAADLPGLAALRDMVTPALTAVEPSDPTGPAWRAMAGDRVGAMSAFALQDGGRLRGILYLAGCQPGALGEEQQAIGLEIADQLAIAAQQARLREELRQHAEELEHRVEERTAQLQETNAALEAFSYTISHDLRAPLRAMEGIARAIVEDFGDRLGPAGRDYAGRVVVSARKMDALIQDLLDYSRLSRVDLHPQAVSLSAIVAEAIQTLRDRVDARHAEVAVSGPMPEVLAHGPTLAQVVANLMGNGLKFVAPGVTPRLHLWAERRGGRVRLWVEDNGLGIAPREQDRIFGVFERLHGDEAYPGTGIGLAIVKKGVERMGGAAGVESEPGRGSRFWIELPGG